MVVLCVCLLAAIPDSKEVSAQESIFIMITNDLDKSICNVFVSKENDSGWDDKLEGQLEAGEFIYLNLIPSMYELRIEDCSNRIVYEDMKFVVNTNQEITIQEPKQKITIENNSSLAICLTTIKFFGHYLDSWHIRTHINPGDHLSINLLAAEYKISLFACDGQLLFQDKEIIINQGKDIYWEVPSLQAKLKILYNNASSRNICFLYLPQSHADYLGRDYLLENPLEPGEQIIIKLPPGVYHLLALDCKGKLIFQAGRINLEKDQIAEITIPAIDSSLFLQSSVDICGFYITGSENSYPTINLMEYVYYSTYFIQNEENREVFKALTEYVYGPPLYEVYTDLPASIYNLRIEYCDSNNYESESLTELNIQGEQKIELKDPRSWNELLQNIDPKTLRYALVLSGCICCGSVGIIPFFIAWRLLRKRR